MNQHYDAVVVGGGAGGTYAAWQMQTGDVSAASRLAQDPAQRSIALFELSDRIGGRLESIVPPAMQTLYAEFGGMGFTSNDTILNALVQQLGLASEPFPRGGANNILYLRGVHFTNANATNPSIVPYRLAPTSRESTRARSYRRRSRTSSPAARPGLRSSGQRRPRSRTTAGA